MSGINTAIENAVMMIRINRPERRNALDPVAYDALSKALMRAAKPDVRAVILTGEGDKAFCAGHDLSAMAEDDPAEDLRFVDGIIRTMRGLPKPIIAAINGVAVGGGLSLALAADVRLMSDTARLMTGFLEMALIPDLGASALIVRALGYHGALRWIMSGKAMTATDAKAAGLVCDVVPAATLLDSVKNEAARLAAMPTRALGFTKIALERAQTLPIAEVLELEALLQAEAGQSPDYQEALAAFREKRAPRFTGK